MFALHALWRADRRLAIWAEGPRLADEDDRPPYPWHPYACPTETVARLLSGVGTGVEWLVTTHAHHGSTQLLLPSRSATPLSSPELQPPEAGPVGRTALQRWRVPSLLFAAAEAAQILGELHDPARPFLPTELPGLGILDVPYGASVRWLTAVHDLAWRMVGQGQVLPALVTEDGEAYARWRPAPDPAHWSEAAGLASITPPICRAEAGSSPRDAAEPAAGKDTRQAGRQGSEVLGDLLDVLVDCEARAALEETSGLLPGVRGRGPAVTAAERWLEALSSRSGLMGEIEPGAYAALQGSLAAWHRSESSPRERLRVCFRLVEPLDTDKDWFLEFLLQSVEEPSLMVEAAEVWADGPGLRALERKADRPKEVLRTELARASRLCPLLRPALQGVHRSRVALSMDQAVEFLNESAPSLAEAGFGVLLPAWWRRPVRVGLALTARTPPPGAVRGDSLLRKDTIVDFGWKAALGDHVLDEWELADLAAAKQPLVRVRGQWLEVDPSQIAAAAAFLASRAGGRMPAGELVRTALSADARISGLHIVSVTADGRLGALLDGGLDLEPVVLPAGFGTELRPYQERGVAWLSLLGRLGLGAVLADDMGLGKTVQTLALLAASRTEAPSLVVCPMSVVGNWQREAARFAPMLDVHVHHGPDRLSGARLLRAVGDADLVITTYGLVQRDFASLHRVRWGRIVADEAQHIKNPATAQAKALAALTSEQRIALTGTPVENRLGDLHAVLDFVNPGLFGSNARFKELYSLPIEKTGSQRATEALRRRTRPLVLRRLKTDPSIIHDLPDKQEMTVLCNLTAEQAALYRAVVTDLFSGVRRSPNNERQARVLATLSKLKQICNHPGHFLKEGSVAANFADRSGKVALLGETLEEALSEGDKVLVFTQFTEFGELLRRHLDRRLGLRVPFLHGGVSRRDREAMVDGFQASSDPGVLLLSVKAGGTGLNLTAANQVVHIDRWWNPAVEEQATDRAFRIGQRRDVQVRKFLCVGTVEERIDLMIEAKRSLAETVITPGEHWLADLSTDALHELLTLSPDAVSE